MRKPDLISDVEEYYLIVQSGYVFLIFSTHVFGTEGLIQAWTHWVILIKIFYFIFKNKKKNILSDIFLSNLSSVTKNKYEIGTHVKLWKITL